VRAACRTRTFAATLHAKGANAYKFLGNTLIHLPSPRTIRAVRNGQVGGLNLSPECVARFARAHDAEFFNGHESARVVTIAWDEMSLISEIDVNVASQEVTGFATTGDASQSLKLKDVLLPEQTVPQEGILATHFLQLAVSSISVKYVFPIGCFLTAGLTAHMLVDIVQRAVILLTAAGFRVLATCGDGASENRALGTLLCSRQPAMVRRYGLTRYPYDPTARFVFANLATPSEAIAFSSDSHHNVKKLRNSMCSSFMATKKGVPVRMMVYIDDLHNDEAEKPKEHPIAWQHWIDAFKYDEMQRPRTSPKVRVRSPLRGYAGARMLNSPLLLTTLLRLGGGAASVRGRVSQLVKQNACHARGPRNEPGHRGWVLAGVR
jgi:hypothetical protein